MGENKRQYVFRRLDEGDTIEEIAFDKRPSAWWINWSYAPRLSKEWRASKAKPPTPSIQKDGGAK